MGSRKPRVKFTDRAEYDVERCGLFLRRKGSHRAGKRILDLRREARRIANDPKLYPVEWVHPVSRIEFRRKNVDQFVILYAYFEPSPLLPNGLVSVRAIRHGSQQDIRLGVEESRPTWLSGAIGPLYTA